MTLDLSPSSCANAAIAVAGSEDDASQASSVMSKSSKGRGNSLGRKGDPRMHKAVAARLANPAMPLVDALRIGGFEFPEDCGDDATALDADNVTLGQRKNQLSRRVRLAKQSPGERKARKHVAKAAKKLFSDAQAELKNKTVQQSSQLQNGITTPANKRKAPELSFPVPDEVTEVLDAQDELTNAREQMAKFHPQYQPLFVSPTNSSPSPAPPVSAWEAVQAARELGLQSSSELTGEVPPSVLRGSGINGNMTLANGVPMFQQPHLPGHHHHESGLAVASLSASASAVGLTLEQLACALSSTTNIAKVLAEQSIPEVKEQLALNIFRTEVSTLYGRCMLMAGFDQEDAQETSFAYRQFAFKAWTSEGQRLEQEIGRMAATMQAEAEAETSKKQECCSQETCSCSHQQEEEPCCSQEGPCCSPQDRPNDRLCFAGHHVHRLEGKCGHQAVIHQPDGAPAHVDFVVNGKVECYEGIKPVGTDEALWPSRYNCDELSCPDHDSILHKVACECEAECPKLDFWPPKSIPLSEVNLDGKEWNSEFFLNSDGDSALLGLVGFSASEDDQQTN